MMPNGTQYCIFGRIIPCPVHDLSHNNDLHRKATVSLCQRDSIWMNALVAWLTSARIQAELCAALNPGGLVLGGAKQHCRSVLPATVSTCTCSFAHSSISKLLRSRYIQLKISPRLFLQHCQQLRPARTDKTRLRLLASIQ